MAAPINSNKHYVHRATTTVGTGAIVNDLIAQSVVAPATANSFSVEEGSIIKAIFVEMWVLSNAVTGANTQFNMCIEKVPAGATNMTIGQILNLGAYPNKKNILYNTQGVISGEDTNSVNIFRQWIKIPKGKQRMGLSDELVLNLSATGISLVMCGFYTYKEYR